MSAIFAFIDKLKRNVKITRDFICIRNINNINVK